MWLNKQQLWSHLHNSSLRQILSSLSQIRKQKFTEVFHQHIEEPHHKLTSVWPEASTDWVLPPCFPFFHADSHARIIYLSFSLKCVSHSIWQSHLSSWMQSLSPSLTVLQVLSGVLITYSSTLDRSWPWIKASATQFQKKKEKNNIQLIKIKYNGKFLSTAFERVFFFFFGVCVLWNDSH